MMKNDNEIIEAIPWIAPLLMYKQWIYTKKWWFFFKKNDESILWGCPFITKNLWKHTKIQLSNGEGIRHTDCLRKFFKAVIYWSKKRWGMVIYNHAKMPLNWTNKREFTRCKTMKTWENSRHTSSSRRFSCVTPGVPKLPINLVTSDWRYCECGV